MGGCGLVIVEVGRIVATTAAIEEGSSFIGRAVLAPRAREQETIAALTDTHSNYICEDKIDEEVVIWSAVAEDSDEDCEGGTIGLLCRFFQREGEISKRGVVGVHSLKVMLTTCGRCKCKFEIAKNRMLVALLNIRIQYCRQ